MKKLRRIVTVVTIVLLGTSLSACNRKAPPIEIDGALSNEETGTITPSPSITPEITPVVDAGVQGEGDGDRDEKDEMIDNPGSDAEFAYDDVLGRCTTSYHNSSDARRKNIENAAKKINGISILPGEIFSCYEVLKPYTEANGYEVASAYEDGKIIASIGGGVCQVSTTLYNAVLEAELEIVERHPHSMTVSYVELAKDAAIAGDYMDFRFKNDSEHPVVIEAVVGDGTLSFMIIGEELRDTENREIEFQTIILSETPPPEDVISYDDTQPKSYTKVTQAAHTGYEAALYKVIYENGNEVERYRINKSVYEAAPQYITVGTLEE